jgi:predicted flap endonuclease-1-like 5' DNA nuclease
MGNVLVAFFVAMSETPLEAPVIPVWFWVLVILILLVLPLLVFVFGPGFARKESEAIAAAEAAKEATPEPKPAEEESTAVGPDDLTKIEGIGPKISGVLQAAGIETFAQLAAVEASTLQEILDSDARLRLADPTSWPEQSQLAAAGDWEALTTLQDELKGGRQV